MQKYNFFERTCIAGGILSSKKTKPIRMDGFCFLVDDIGLEPMTFRTSKEFPTGRCIPVGKNTVFFGGKSVNRVDPIDTN